MVGRSEVSPPSEILYDSLLARLSGPEVTCYLRVFLLDGTCKATLDLILLAGQAPVGDPTHGAEGRGGCGARGVEILYDSHGDPGQMRVEILYDSQDPRGDERRGMLKLALLPLSLGRYV